MDYRLNAVDYCIKNLEYRTVPLNAKRQQKFQEFFALAINGEHLNFSLSTTKYTFDGFWAKMTFKQSGGNLTSLLLSTLELK